MSKAWLLGRLFRVLCGTMLLASSGCSQLDDWLHMDAPEVVSYSPNGEELEVEADMSVRVRFSQHMHPARSEAAFSLLREGEVQQGSFGETGRELVFYPEVPLTAGYRYRILVDTEAEDLHGNSLKHEFSAVFSTVGAGEVTRVVEHAPEDNGRVHDLRTELVLRFDGAVDQDRFLGEFRLIPETAGEHIWNDDGTIFRFVPHEDWRVGRYQQVEIGRPAAELVGHGAILRHVFGFHAERVPPASVVALEFLPSGVEGVPTPFLIEGVELGDEILVEFDTAVPLREQGRLLRLPSGAGGTLVWSANSRSVRIRNLRLEFGGLYELQVIDERYRFLCNGQRFQAPVIESVSYIATEGEEAVVLAPYATVTLSSSENAVLHMQVRHAPDTKLDLGRLSEAVSMELSLGSGRVELYSVEVDEPVLEPATESAVSTVRVGFELELSGAPGILRIVVRDGMADLRGTHASEEYSLRVSFE